MNQKMSGIMAKRQTGSNGGASEVRLKGIVKTARDIMRKDAGLSSELDRVPQFAWLLFLRAFDALEEMAESRDPSFRRSIEGEYRWNYWVRGAPLLRDERLLTFVNERLLPHLRNLSGTGANDPRTILSNVFRETQNNMRSGGLLRDLALKIDQIDFRSPQDIHVMAFIYEGLLRDVRDAAGSAGEFYTPRPVIRFMVQQSYLHERDSVLDPACGTGGFLVEAFTELATESRPPKTRQAIARRIQGIEKKPLPFLLGTMNLLLHEMNGSRITRGNALLMLPHHEKVDTVLTNPPFGAEEEEAVFAEFSEDYRTRETSWLFLVSAMDVLKRHGKCAIVVPNNILSNQQAVGYRVKRRFEEEFKLHTVVRLPEGVFSPYTKLASNLLFFERGQDTTDVWFYEVPVGTGAKAYTKTRLMKDDHLNECRDWWGGPTRLGRQETDWAWKVSKAELVSRRWNLDLTHPSRAKVSYGSPSEILGDIRRNGNEFVDIIRILIDEAEAE